MDPFTQRMLERARARQEKIDQKLASSGQTVPKRKPLTENNLGFHKPAAKSPTKSPNVLKSESPKLTTLKQSPQKNDMVIKHEFKSPRDSSTSCGSDVSVEINIMHRNDVQIEVQVEERDAPIKVSYDKLTEGSNVIIHQIEDNPKRMIRNDENEPKSALRHNIKSRLDRLGVLYSDDHDLSSPIHRTESEFTSSTPPAASDRKNVEAKDGRRKYGRLAALADQINNWEDDLTHHNYHQPETKKAASKPEKHDASALDVSIHSYQDIGKALQTSKTVNKKATSINTRTYTKQPPNDEGQHLDKEIVAELEGEGYRRDPAGQSRLVYDFSLPTVADRARQEPRRASPTPMREATPKMAAAVASPPAAAASAVTKKPSIKKYRAPTPPKKVDDDCDRDKENEAEAEIEKPAGSPVIRTQRDNGARSSVLSKAAMFEAGSPKARERDPAEMSLRERKALFEKNKGAAIVPKAPFGLAPSVKALQADSKAEPRAVRPVIATPIVPSKPNQTANNDDNISQSSLGGGIKGKLAALFSKEQTISETTIANKFKQEREREMEMLQNRFQYNKSKDPKDNDTDSENDPSEQAPLMGSTLSLSHIVAKKPEIVAKLPKVSFLKENLKSKSTPALNDDAEKLERDVVGSQPSKRRSSQDSPVVLSVLDDVKRIKVTNNNHETPSCNGTTTKPGTLYPHLSDIETDTSNNDEHTDCGGSYESSNEKLNKSDNWADTSFGREVMNVVKNNSYKTAIRDHSELSDSEAESGASDVDLDELLDEALEDGDGPTPPKLNKNTSSVSSSKSFEYRQQDKATPKGTQFKSPLKPGSGGGASGASKTDRGNELVHSVSFYRRMQSASQPSTPVRVVRHGSPERGAVCAAAAAAESDTARVTTVRERIKQLQDEICKQQTVISQASQALNLCAATIEFSGSTEQAEGERLLLLATHRRQACMHEMQRLQVEGAGPAAAAGSATLHIRGLAVPLRRDYIRQLNADGAVGHHAVCLLKCRDRVLATSMRQSQPTDATLRFPDDIRMEGLTSDFKVTVEMYLLQASKEVLPHDVKYHIYNKKGNSKMLTPKSKVSELKTPRVQSPGGPLSVRTPQFQLHGYCIFALPQANRRNFTLNKVPCGSPLEGSVLVEVSARVQTPLPPERAAFLTAFDDVSGLGAWHRRWFALRPPRLAYWKYPDDVNRKMPIGDIDLATVVSEKAIRAPRDLCARPNTILLECTVPSGLVPDSGSLVYVRKPDGTVVRRHLLAADTAQDRDVWLERLNEALEYVRCMAAGDE